MEPFPLMHHETAMTFSDWFGMLKIQQADIVEEGEKSYIYGIDTDAPWYLDGQKQESGLYFTNANAEQIHSIQEQTAWQITKLSFSSIVFLSDCFSNVAKNSIESSLQEDGKSIEELAEEGVCNGKIEAGCSIEGLEKMRAKVWTKYYEGKGFTGFLRQCFSAIANFFRKYTYYLDTGIYWPGHSCHYADQVIHKIHQIKIRASETVLQASKANLCKKLDVQTEDYDTVTAEELKKLYRKKMVQYHPDKTKDEELIAKGRKLALVHRDFAKLNDWHAKT